MAAIDTVQSVRDTIAPYMAGIDTRAQTRNAINNARASLDGALGEARHLNIGRARNQLLETVRLIQAGDRTTAAEKVAIAVHVLDRYIAGER